MTKIFPLGFLGSYRIKPAPSGAGHIGRFLLSQLARLAQRLAGEQAPQSALDAIKQGVEFSFGLNNDALTTVQLAYANL